MWLERRSSGLVGREEEASALVALLDALSEDHAALLLIGEAGIGKTTLWRVVCQLAGGAGDSGALLASVGE